MPTQPNAHRSSRRPETQIEESDIAAIFERRLLGRGIRTDDFIAWRDSTELPTIPGTPMIRFGRNAENGDLPPLAIAPPPMPVVVDATTEPAESQPPDSTAPDPDSEPDND